MKKIKTYFVVACASILVCSCGENNGSQSISKTDSTALTSDTGYTFPETPTYDEPSFQIHYLRADNDYSPWCLWLWTADQDGADYEFNGGDSINGAIASYPLSKFGLGEEDTLSFLVKKGREGNWLAKDPDEDREIDFSSLSKDNNDIYHIYLKSGDANVYTSKDYIVPEKINFARFNSTSTGAQVVLETTLPINKAVLKRDGVVIKETTLSKPKSFVRIQGIEGEIDFLAKYSVEVTFAESNNVVTKDVSFNSLFGTNEFNAKYEYTGTDLGVTEKDGTFTFKVWSPFSSSIEVRIYDSGTPKSLDETGDDAFTTLVLNKGEKGVWSGSLNQELYGKYYTLFVKSKDYPQGIEIVDPYAKGCGINGLRGMIVDFNAAKPTNWDSFKAPVHDRKSMVVYETHIADISSSSSWTSDVETRILEKTYAGAIKEGTTYTKEGKAIKTGYDSIKDLGVNAVQILPIFDQANDERKENRTFNWGYNPLNYNCIEGSYSSNPYDGYTRIKEFRELVEKFGNDNMSIIMDVVYNHVNGAKGSNFDVLAPGYYFRYDGEKLTSKSGCGNDTASDHAMYAHFMRDSVKFLAETYKLSGFRFDLMGLHTLEAMNEVVAAARSVNPDIVIYGEPWEMEESLGLTMASQKNLASFEGFGAFNDKLRDALIKGGMSAVDELGFATNPRGGSESDMRSVVSGIEGKTSTISFDPDKTVNYASCHDNYTLYDRAYMAGIDDEELLKKMPVLANSIVLTSQGTSFILSGEEFLRTKDKVNGDGTHTKDGNSYSSSYEVNALDYDLKSKNMDVYAIYKKLIYLKTHVDGLALTKDGVASNLNVTASKGQITYTIKDSLNNKEYKIVHNDGASIHEAMDFAGYELYLDTIDVNSTRKLTNNEKANRFQTLIGVKSL